MVKTSKGFTDYSTSFNSNLSAKNNYTYIIFEFSKCSVIITVKSRGKRQKPTALSFAMRICHVAYTYLPAFIQFAFCKKTTLNVTNKNKVNKYDVTNRTG